MKKSLYALLLIMFVAFSSKGTSEEVTLTPSEYLRKACESLEEATKNRTPSAWREAVLYLGKAIKSSKPGDSSWTVASEAVKQVLSSSPFLEDSVELLKCLKIASESHSVSTKAKSISCLSYTPDGNKLVVGYADGTIEILDAITLKSIACLEGFWESVVGLCYSPYGASVVPIALGYYAYRFSLKDGSLLAKYELKYHLVSAAFSDDGKYLLLGSSTKSGRSELKMFDAQTHALIYFHEDENLSIEDLQFSTDGKNYLVTGTSTKDGDKYVTCASYSIETGEMQEQLFEVETWNWSRIESALRYISKSNEYVIIRDEFIYIVNAEAREEPERLRTYSDIQWQEYDEHNGMLWLVTRKTLEGLKVAEREFKSYDVGNYYLTTAAFSPINNKLIVGNTGGEVYLFPDNTLLWKAKDEMQVEQLAFSPDGTQVIVKVTGAELVHLDLTHLRLFELLAKANEERETGTRRLLKQLKSVQMLSDEYANEEMRKKGRDLLIRYLKTSIVESAPFHTGFAIEHIRSKLTYFNDEKESVRKVLESVILLSRLSSDIASPVIFLTTDNANENLFAAFENGEICIWRLRDSKRLLHDKLDIKNKIIAQCIRGRIVSVVTKDDRIFSYNVSLGVRLCVDNVGKPLKSLQYPDWGFESLAVTEDGTAHIFEQRNGIIRDFVTDKRIVEAYISLSGKACATKYEDGSIGIWATDYTVRLIEDLKVDEPILDFQFESRETTTALALLFANGKMRIITIERQAIEQTKDLQLPFTPTAFGPMTDYSMCYYYLEGNGVVESTFGSITRYPALTIPCPLRSVSTIGVRFFFADCNGNLTAMKMDDKSWSVVKQYQTPVPVTCISSFRFHLGIDEQAMQKRLDSTAIVIGYANGSISFLD